jgi:hypothetical protein
MNKRIRTILYWAGILVGISVFTNQLISGLEFLKAIDFSSISFVHLLLGLILSVISNGIRYLGWIQIMASLGVKLSYLKNMSGYAFSFLPRYIPGSIWGYISRSEWLYQSNDIPHKVSFIGSSIELAIVISSATMLVGMNLALESGKNELLLIIPLLILIIWYGICRWSSSIQIRVHINSSSTVREIFTCDRRHLIAAGIFYTISWLLSSSILLFIVHSFRIPSQMSLLDASMNFSLAWFIGFIVVFVPSGLGIRELSLSKLLSANYGLYPFEANAIAVVTRVLHTSGELIWLLISFIISKVIKNN